MQKISAIIIVLCLYALKTNAQQLITYPPPQAVVYSMHNDDYTVKVRTPGGEWQDLYEYNVKVDLDKPQDASMVYFDFSGAVEVFVQKNNGNMQSVKIRPSSYGIKPTVNGNSITFTLTEPRKLSIEFDGDKLHNLHLFANPIETSRPDPNDPNVIYFGPGVHLPKDLPGDVFNIPSGKTVYIAGGAIVRGKLLCDKVKNVRIIGRGIIDQPERGVEIRNSSDVTVDGIIVVNPKHYTVFAGGSDHITIRNLKSFSDSPWSDGLDFMSCSDVAVDDVFMRNSDDCIAVYGHRWEFYGDAKNYSVTNSILWADVAHTINIGVHGDGEKSGEVIENLLFKNIDILELDEDDPVSEGCMAIQAADKNLVRNVRFEDIRVDNFQEGKLLQLRVSYFPKYNSAPGRGVENIYFKNINYDGFNISPSIIDGLDKDHLIKDVTFDNLRINGKLITTAEEANIKVGGFAKNVTFKTTGETFVHPGGLHTQADLDRMKTKVAERAHPWIDSWNALIAHPKAQNTYTAAAQANMGVSRQRASADAVAAYLNALRWYISGDTSYAACSRKILNAWAAAADQVPSGHDIPGLMGIAIYEFAVAAEILRLYPNWPAADFARFKHMMTTYLYPNCHDFLTRHNGTCISHYWANWDICNITAILSIGVLCDDTAKFNEAIAYFKSGAGNGNIEKAIPFLHPGGLGQWQETGRDQEHALLGLGMLASFCQIAWNQGQDLYGYDNNRLLAGAEYVAQYNLWAAVPYDTYTNCDSVSNFWPSEENAWGRGRLQRPIWEMIYNHYVVRKGLSAPHVKAMAEVNRPEGFEHDDNLGFGTLCYTIDAAASPYPASPPPAVPAGLKATESAGKVALRWLPVPTANGYKVMRSTTRSGPYTTIVTYKGTFPLYEDNSVVNGTTYYYEVSAANQAGTSGNSLEAHATPEAAGPLPASWARQDIGTVGAAGIAGYSDVGNGTFVMSGSGTGIGGTSDGLSYVYKPVTGDATITARLAADTWTGGGLQKTGIMIRQSLSSTAMVFSMTAGDGGAREARFGSRTSADSSMRFQTGDLYTHAPTWFRLQRTGDRVTAYQSTDGKTWFAVGAPVKASTAGAYYVGLAVSSNSTNLNTATFDNVTVTERK